MNLIALFYVAKSAKWYIVALLIVVSRLEFSVSTCKRSCSCFLYLKKSRVRQREASSETACAGVLNQLFCVSLGVIELETFRTDWVASLAQLP